MPLQIVGLGWGRTGTLSLKSALEILGFAPCYHMTELLRRPEHVTHWNQAINGESVCWDALFHEYKATVDYPACRHWDSIGRHFKNVRYILTVRDPDSWYQSVKSTIYQAEPNLFGKLKIMMQLPFSEKKRKRLEVFRFIKRSIWELDFDGRFEDKKYAIKKYKDHINSIRETIDADKLLIFDVKFGWGPLCSFLSVNVPDAVPFPVLNKREQFNQFIGRYL